MRSAVLTDEKRLPLFKQLARSHPPCCDDVHFPLVITAAGRKFVVRTRHGYLSRDGAVLVEPVGPLFAAEIRKRRVHHQSYSNWSGHLDEVFVRINREPHYLWRAVDNERRSARGFRNGTAGSQGCV